MISIDFVNVQSTILKILKSIMKIWSNAVGEEYNQISIGTFEIIHTFLTYLSPICKLRIESGSKHSIFKILSILGDTFKKSMEKEKYDMTIDVSIVIANSFVDLIRNPHWVAILFSVISMSYLCMRMETPWA